MFFMDSNIEWYANKNSKIKWEKPIQMGLILQIKEINK